MEKAFKKSMIAAQIKKMSILAEYFFSMGLLNEAIDKNNNINTHTNIIARIAVIQISKN